MSLPEFISLGLGVQSSTMSLLAKHRLIEPMPKGAIFANTHREPQAVYDWFQWLRDYANLPFPIYVVSKGDLWEQELRLRLSRRSGKVYRKQAIPAFIKPYDGSKVGLLPRHCTVDFKITPVLRELKRLAGIKRGEKAVKVVQWIGISTDEAHRMKDPPKPWIKNRYPLIELGMSREDCKAWTKENGYREPPRSACYFCPFHSDEEWLNLDKESFALAVEFERQLQAANTQNEVSKGVPFLHNSCLPLERVQFKKGKNKEHWGNECQGMCGM